MGKFNCTFLLKYKDWLSRWYHNNRKMNIKMLTVGMFFLLICCGCNTKSNDYTIIVYEKEPIEFEIHDSKKIEQLDQYIATMILESKKLDSDMLSKPKSFSYVIKKNNNEEYMLTGGFLFHRNDCFQVDDYENKINELKSIYEDD